MPKLTDFMPMEIQERHELDMEDGRKLTFRPPSSFSPMEMIDAANIVTQLRESAVDIKGGDAHQFGNYRRLYALHLRMLLPELTDGDVAALKLEAMIAIVQWYNEAYGLKKTQTQPPSKPPKAKPPVRPRRAKSA